MKFVCFCSIVLNCSNIIIAIFEFCPGKVYTEQFFMLYQLTLRIIAHIVLFVLLVTSFHKQIVHTFSHRTQLFQKLNDNYCTHN